MRRPTRDQPDPRYAATYYPQLQTPMGYADTYQAAPVTDGKITKRAPRRSVRIDEQRAGSLPPEQVNVREPNPRIVNRPPTPPGVLCRNSVGSSMTQGRQTLDSHGEPMETTMGMNPRANRCLKPIRFRRRFREPQSQEPQRHISQPQIRNAQGPSKTPKETIPINLVGQRPRFDIFFYTIRRLRCLFASYWTSHRKSGLKWRSSCNRQNRQSEDDDQHYKLLQRPSSR